MSVSQCVCLCVPKKFVIKFQLQESLKGVSSLVKGCFKEDLKV